MDVRGEVRENLQIRQKNARGNNSDNMTKLDELYKSDLR